MRPRLPKQPKTASTGSHMAFGGGAGAHAFRDPATMVAPDQAFTAAMGRGKVGTAPSAAPAGPAASSAPGGGASSSDVA